MAQRLLRLTGLCLLAFARKPESTYNIYSLQSSYYSSFLAERAFQQFETTCSSRYRDVYSKDYSTEKISPPRPWIDLSYTQLMNAIRKKEVQLFDVRTVEEIEETGMMPGATNIPLSELEEAVSLTPEEFQIRYGVKKPAKGDRDIMCHCLGGVRSLTALEIFHEAGFYLARHYRGGWEEYEELKDKKDIDAMRPWTDVSFEELMSMIKAKDIQLFDVRRAEEIESTGKIPGSINIPISDFGTALNMSNNEFRGTYGVDIPCKNDDNVVIHCLAGFRSLAALSIAWEAGYERFRQYPGGWLEYSALINQ